MRKFTLLTLYIFAGTLNLFSQNNGFVAAYDSMHQVFSVYYPMGTWKGIDFDALNATIRPKIETAGVANDTIAFYTALQQYATSIHDGHVNIRHGWADIRAAAIYKQIGGSYGFVVTGLDDGRIVARLIDPGSPADLGGMGFGAEIIEVNDYPVLEVLDTIPVLWAEIIPATLEAKRLNQYRFLGRAPVGHSIKIKFLNRGASDPTTVILVAVNDDFSTYNQTSIVPVFDSVSSVTAQILEPGGFGYIKLTSVYGDSSGIVKLYTEFRDAIINFKNSNAPGMILDLRSNVGGFDAIAAALSGFFYNETAFYEYQTWYNPETDTLEIWPLPIEHFDPSTLKFYINPDFPAGALYTEPQGVYFDKPVIVLVGPRNISSGEGPAMMLQKLPNCKVLSFYGSNGSFAMVDRQHFFFPPPEDLYLRYPYGVSLDQSFSIQLDSDSTMTGGVIPDIRVPINDSVIDQLYIEGTDVELNYAIRELNSLLTIDKHQQGSKSLIFEQIYPNPVKSPVTIYYTLKEAAVVSLSVYDIYGRLIKTIADEQKNSGHYCATWNVENTDPGVYFLRIRSGKYIITQKCVVL